MTLSEDDLSFEIRGTRQRGTMALSRANVFENTFLLFQMQKGDFLCLFETTWEKRYKQFSRQSQRNVSSSSVNGDIAFLRDWPKFDPQNPNFLTNYELR